jgi:DNA-binding beta-propeller fold protein YncE
LGRKVGQPPTSSRPDEHADDFGGYYASYFNKDVEGTVFDNDGILYAGNEDEGTVVLFAEKGERLGAFTSEEKGGLKKIQGLAVNREKTRLYVCDEGNMRVQVFEVARIKKTVLQR